MRLLSAVARTFKEIDPVALEFIFTGLKFTVGLLFVTMVLTLSEGYAKDYIALLECIKGARDAAFSCGALSLVAAFLCDAAAKDKLKRN